MLDKVFIILVVLLLGCNQSGKKEVKTITSITIEEQSNYSLSNPSIFMGTSFGSFFQMLHKTGNYNEMLVYTSKINRKKFSDKQLLEFYTNIQFSYPLKLKAKKEENKKIILLYQTTINATQKTIQIPIIIENDTCKVIWDNLDISKPFIGM